MLDVLCRHLPMVRLRIAALATMAIAAAACTGDIVDPEGDPLEQAVRAFDTTVAPTMQAKCASCHVSTENPQFMRPNPTLREGVMTFNEGGLISLTDPQASRLSVYASSQAHASVGVNYLPAEAAAVTAWIELEALAMGVVAEPVVETSKITPVIGANEVDLTRSGSPARR
jgi:hypothetical protein